MFGRRSVEERLLFHTSCQLFCGSASCMLSELPRTVLHTCTTIQRVLQYCACFNTVCTSKYSVFFNTVCATIQYVLQYSVCFNTVCASIVCASIQCVLQYSVCFNTHSIHINTYRVDKCCACSTFPNSKQSFSYNS